MKNKIIPLALAGLMTCTTALAVEPSLSPEEDYTEYSSDKDSTSDPLEFFNRPMHSFNEKADKYFLKPVASAYKSVAPEVVEIGIRNFFSNIGEVNQIVNNTLQGNFSKATSSTGRLLMNSTFGLFGLVDVASKAGISKTNTDFGQTLGYWGMDSGAYVVLPLVGPSTVRDSVGFSADMYVDPLRWSTDNEGVKNSLRFGRVVSTRAEYLELKDRFDSVSLDSYIAAREAYLANRQFKIDNLKEDQ